jgi:GT2 family glycosyltransferase
MADEQVPPVVAVVVTSDPGPWLEECLEALQAQDYGWNEATTGSNGSPGEAPVEGGPVGSSGPHDHAPALTSLVIDAASAEPLAERVAAVAPEVYLHRLDRNDGFGPSANAVLDLVEGAAFFLLCHDDVVPEPDAVRRMVEEAFRSNAGIVSPKLVDYRHPDRLLQLGLGADRFGAPLRRVQPGELDQSQHDEVRDVFAAPGACTLIRADLFAALGGFDPAISMLGEDVDLCWRARLAGARIVVAPTARVRHVEATASRQRPLPEARALQWRHELRAVLKNYRPLRRWIVVSELAVLSALEAAWFAAHGKRWRARLVLAAWRWNLARRSELREARAALASVRRVSDREVSRAMERGTSRIERYLRGLAEGALRERTVRIRYPAAGPVLPAIGAATDSSAGLPELGASGASGAMAAAAGVGLAGLGLGLGGPRAGRLGSVVNGADGPPVPAVRRRVAEPPLAPTGLVTGVSSHRGPVAVLVVASAILLVGLRSLFLGHLPLVGGMLPFPGPTRLLGDFLGGWQDAGLQAPGPASPALGLVGLAGLVIGGGTSLVWKVVLLGSVALGAIGAARLVRPFVSLPGRIGAAIAYLFLPLAWDDLARADSAALVAFAATPFVLGRLVSAIIRPRRSLLAQSLALGLLLALAGSFAPGIVPLTVEMALGLALAGLVAGGWGQRQAGVRCCAVAGGGIAASLVFTLPWSATWLQPGAAWSLATGAAHLPGTGPSLGAVLAFDLGPVGRGPLAYGLLAAGVITVLVGRGDRLDWGSRLLVLAGVSGVVAWAGGAGWLGPGGGDVRLLVTPAAVSIAGCVGLGVATVTTDLAESGLGWRHAAAALCAVAGVAGLFPVVGAARTGRFGVPSNGYDTVLSYLAGPAPSLAPASSTVGSAAGGSSGARAPAAGAASDAQGVTAASDASSPGGSVLWLGDPGTLPLSGWQLAPGLAAGISDGLPDGTRLFSSPSAQLMATLGRELHRAEAGLTVTLAATLAAQGIRYVVVTTASAPVLASVQAAPASPPPPALVPALQSQLQLAQLAGEGGADVFVDTAWRPPAAAASLPGGTPAAVRELALVLALLLAAGASVSLLRGRPRRPVHRPARPAAHRAPRPLAVAARIGVGEAEGDVLVPARRP